MNPLAYYSLLNGLSPDLGNMMAMYNLFRQPVQQGPVSSPWGQFGGGQAFPGGFQGGPVSIPSFGIPAAPAAPVQAGPVSVNTPIVFRPVIVQNQYNHMPLRNIGGINATQVASANLNVNGRGIF